MKERIYTIPISEAFEKDDGCPVCRLRAMLENESLDYAVSPAMMEPDVRITMNKLGFCAGHYKKLMEKQKRLPLALMLESRLETLVKDSNPSAGNGTCFICSRSGGFISDMIDNIVYLWMKEESFKEKFKNASICLPHAGDLLKSAKKEAGKKGYNLFSSEINEKMKEELIRLKESVTIFCKSFDHRNAGTDIGEHKKAVENAISFLSGENL